MAGGGLSSTRRAVEALIPGARQGEANTVVALCDIIHPVSVTALMKVLYPVGGCPGCETFDAIADAYSMWEESESLTGLPASAR